MQSNAIRSPGTPVIPLAAPRVDHQDKFASSTKTTGEVQAQSRFVELEAQLNDIRRDLGEVHGDVNSIKHRLAYSAAGTAVVLGLLGWIGNSRFEQLVVLLLR